jgi:hypothetical protein
MLAAIPFSRRKMSCFYKHCILRHGSTFRAFDHVVRLTLHPRLHVRMKARNNQTARKLKQKREKI